MAGEFDQITNALKIAYSSKVITAMVNEETPFRKAIKKSLPAGGRHSDGGLFKFGANFSPPQNQGQTTDGGTLPTPQDRTQDQFQLTPTIFTGGFQIGWVTKSAASTNKSAFNGGELRRRTDETLADLAKYIETTYAGTHGTGRIGTIQDATTTLATFVVAKPEGTTLFREGQYITVRTTDGGATLDDDLDYARITAVNHDTRTVTVGAATGGSTTFTMAAGTHIHRVLMAAQVIAPNFSSTGASNMANGIRGLIDDATYSPYLHTLSRATYPKLNTNVSSNGGTLRSLTEQILINTCHKVRQRSGKRVTDAWMNSGQVEKYIEFVAPDRRYNVNGKGTQGMGTGYQEGDLVHYAPGVQMKMNVSFDIIPREIYLLNWDSFFHYVAEDMDWWDNGSGMLKPTPVSGSYKASYLAFLRSIENIGCDMPIANAVIRDLKDPLCGDL